MNSKLEKRISVSIMIVFALLVITIFYDVNLNRLKEGMEVPDFRVYNLEGKAFTKSNFKGKIIVVNFWASWCPPCIEEMPLFVEIKKRYQESGIELVLANVGENVDDIRNFIDKNKFAISVYRDPNKEASRMFGTYKYPETYIIDQDGILRKKIIGSITWRKEEVLNYLDGIIKE